jgi:hypothetical protein
MTPLSLIDFGLLNPRVQRGKDSQPIHLVWLSCFNLIHKHP